MATESNALTDLSEALAAAVEKAARSIVTVDARRRFGASGIVWTADGIIVTADHVVERDENITVTLPGGTEAAATIVGRDPGSDIAVLKVEKTGLTPIEHGQAAKVGNLALAVGRPAGGEPGASFGVVGAVGGAWRTFRGGTVDGYLRSDTTFYPGFSGGPLVDGAGRALGLNSSRLGRGSGMTVPIAAVATVVEALRTSGKIRRGYLGIGSQAAQLPEALAASLGGQASGLLIVGVEPGSPADSAGLLLGDILVAMGGTPLTETDDLQGQLGPDSVGKAVPAVILRGGERREITITVGERG